jgi:hypothetical protein
MGSRTSTLLYAVNDNRDEYERHARGDGYSAMALGYKLERSVADSWNLWLSVLIANRPDP